MSEHVVQKVVEQLNDRGVALSTVDVLLVGTAYKPDVSDTRESPVIDIIYNLKHWKANVPYHDLFVPSFEVGEETYESVALTDDRLRQADCVILVTDDSTLDTDHIVETSSFVFDTWNATAGLDVDGADIIRF